MFSIGSLSISSPISDIADFFELCAIKDIRVSNTEMAGFFSAKSENEINYGCNDNDDLILEKINGVMVELEERSRACGEDRYPFFLDQKTGTVLTSLKMSAIVKKAPKLLYIYLLLSTNLNMKKNRIQNDVDGTEVLEEIAAEVLKSYLGGNRAESINFGTSVAGGFSKKIDDLCKRIGEGGGYSEPQNANRHTKDGKLDTVAWIPFRDKLEGKIVVFAQCKTGINWKDHVFQLQPENFIKKYIKKSFHLNPIRSFFVSESVDRSRRNDLSIDGGLLFDRCRIVDYCPTIPKVTLQKMKTWVNGAVRCIDEIIVN